MYQDDVAVELKKLSDRLDDKSKDVWDKAQAVGALAGALLVPVALAVAGYFFSNAISKEQIRSNEIIATNNLRLGQYQLVASVMKSLLSPDALERKQAISFVFIVLTEDEAHRLVDRLSKTDSDSSVRTQAVAVLESRLTELTTDATTADPERSQQAAAQLLAGWRSNPALATHL